MTFVAQHTGKTWNGITIADVVELRTHTGETMYFGKGFGLVATPSEVLDGTLDALESSVNVLAEKAPGEVAAYQDLVLDVATAVAEAKGEVAEEETAAIERIRDALGVRSTT